MFFDQESYSYCIDVLKDEKGEVSEDDAKGLGALINQWFGEYKISILDVDSNILSRIQKQSDYEVIDADKYLGTKEVISSQNYQVVYAFLMLFYLITVFSSVMVATKVSEEKANRVVEYLMTTVRPKALILGKVIAVLVLCVGQLLAVFLVALGANRAAELLFENEKGSMISQYISAEMLSNISVFKIILCFLVLALGVFIYGLVSGLFGASVSRTEELQQGMRVFNLVTMGVFIFCLSVAQTMWTVGIGGQVTFCLLFPLTSVMLLPGAIAIGVVSAPIAAASVVILVITAILVLKLVANVYEAVIVMNGNQVSVKEMIAIYKNRTKRKGKAE